MICVSLWKVSPNSDKFLLDWSLYSEDIHCTCRCLPLPDITSVTFRRLGLLNGVVGTTATLVLSFSLLISSWLHSPSQKHFDYFAQGGHSMSPVLNYIGSVLSSSITLNRNLFFRLQSFCWWFSHQEFGTNSLFYVVSNTFDILLVSQRSNACIVNYNKPITIPNCNSQKDFYLGKNISSEV